MKPMKPERAPHFGPFPGEVQDIKSSKCLGSTELRKRRAQCFDKKGPSCLSVNVISGDESSIKSVNELPNDQGGNKNVTDICENIRKSRRGETFADSVPRPDDPPSLQPGHPRICCDVGR